MIPVNKGYTTPCSPVSSNCVIWQGPDIPCINICNGDTVSDVVGKLAEELCSLIDASCQCNPDISGLDLNCLPSETTLELQPVLQAIIDYLCDLNPGGGGQLPNIQLPACLIYDDPLGNPVTQLPLDQFATLLGNKVCDILSDLNTIELSIIDLQSRVTILENCVLPCVSPGSVPNDFDVISSCLFPGISVPVSQLLLDLESEFCNFRNAVGSISLINNAISAQCLTGLDTRLSGPGTYGSVLGWVNSPSTLAESNVDQWLVICDLYNAVKDIQDNCCDVGCSGVIFGFSYITIDGNSDGVVDSLVLNFTSSTIPSGFSDCGGATIVTITDSYGNSITQSVNVTALSTDPLGVTVSLTGLNTLAPLVLSVPFCVTDGTSTCSERDTVAIPLNIPCPSDLSATAVITDINVAFTNALGTGVTYTINAIDSSTGLPLGTVNITSPGTTISHTFTGAVPGRTYSIIITITQGPSIKTCPPTTVLVPGNETELRTVWFSGGYVPDVNGLPIGQEENDFFLDTSTGNIYKRLSSSWSLEMNILGPAGPAGPAGPTGPIGPTGPAGTPGSEWLSGTGVPNNANGNDGDWYIDLNNEWKYEKVAGVWVLRFSYAKGLIEFNGSTLTISNPTAVEVTRDSGYRSLLKGITARTGQNGFVIPSTGTYQIRAVVNLEALTTVNEAAGNIIIVSATGAQIASSHWATIPLSTQSADESVVAEGWETLNAGDEVFLKINSSLSTDSILPSKVFIYIEKL